MSQAGAVSPESLLKAELRSRLAACRLYLVTDEETPLEDLPKLVSAAVRGGVDAVQLRRKGVEPASLVQIARRCRDAAGEGGALFFVNDHLELALEVGADGLHLGQGDIDPVEARRQLGPDLILGISCQFEREARAAARLGADYLGVGPVVSTPTKPEVEPVGVAGITEVAEATALPLVAIGGLGPGLAGEAISAGADMVAVVRAICSARDPERAAAGLRAEVDAAPRWLRLRADGGVHKVPPQRREDAARPGSPGRALSGPEDPR